MAPATPAVRPAYRTQRQVSDHAIQWIFIAPTLILLVLLNIFPLFYSLYLSFTNYSAIAQEAPSWAGFANFGSILNDRQLWKYDLPFSLSAYRRSWASASPCSCAKDSAQVALSRH
jgi:hypothetical protein